MEKNQLDPKMAKTIQWGFIIILLVIGLGLAFKLLQWLF